MFLVLVVADVNEFGAGLITPSLVQYFGVVLLVLFVLRFSSSLGRLRGLLLRGSRVWVCFFGVVFVWFVLNCGKRSRGGND